MINIQELITDTDFCQSIKVIRRKISIENGRQVEERKEFQTIGIITISRDKTTIQKEYSSTQEESIHVFTNIKLYTAGEYENTKYLSDVVYFSNNYYSVMNILRDGQYGFYRSYCERIELQ